MVNKHSISVVGMITFGTACSLLAKLIYSVEAPSLYGGRARFEKPWFQVFEMFLGMSTCILLELPKRRMERGGSTSLAPPAPGFQSEASPWIIAIPALLDLFATACGTTGLLFTTVSVYQMLRGAMLIWTAILSVIFLGRKMTVFNWVGIVLCVMGIGFVGLANVLGEANSNEKGNTVFGIVIILVGQVLQAVQTVVEEYLLRHMHMSSMRVVAWEGVFGMMHCILWVFPLAYLLPGRDHGHLEDTLDAWYMFSHSWMVGLLVFLDMCFMLVYNVFGMQVTESLSGVHRVVIETLRTLAVWAIDLFIYYIVTNGRLGEGWGEYSYLQLVGFAIMVGGTMLYNYEPVSSAGKPSSAMDAGGYETIPLCSSDEVTSKDCYGATSQPNDVVIALRSHQLEDNENGDKE